MRWRSEADHTELSKMLQQALKSLHVATGLLDTLPESIREVSNEIAPVQCVVIIVKLSC